VGAVGAVDSSLAPEQDGAIVGGNDRRLSNEDDMMERRGNGEMLRSAGGNAGSL
jgi:hypothetical protein